MTTDSLGFYSFAEASVDRSPPVYPLPLAPTPEGEAAALMVGGTFHVECYDSDGNLKWKDRAKNGVTTVGLDHVLNVIFRSGSPITSWYIGLVDNAGTPTFALADTSGSHSGWNPVAAGDLGNANWPAWNPGVPSGSAITNSGTANFNMQPSGSLTVKGLFLISSNVIATLGGTLFSTASFSGGTQAVANGDVLKVTYTVSAANNPSNT